jgi:hypothetical protein
MRRTRRNKKKKDEKNNIALKNKGTMLKNDVNVSFPFVLKQNV